MSDSRLESLKVTLDRLKERLTTLEEVARVRALSESQRAAYEHSLKVYRDNLAIARTERSQGFEEGRAEGREEGRAEGREEGRLEMIRNMCGLGMDAATIAAVAGLPVDEIKELLRDISDAED